MTAYYNEIDPKAAQWLRNLIEAGHIAPGYVDERSIEDVYPSDLRGFTQCHFFAGIGVWSYALRSAGWADDRPVWTGSCPCQPFSAAGKGTGFDDERHLWPAFHHLIKECKPAAVIGEQVASKDADPWIDLVHTDMETLGYAFGAIPFPAASLGAPHIRDRLYWVADSQQHHRGPQAAPADHGQSQTDRPTDRACGCGGASGGVADHDRDGCQPGREGGEAMGYGQASGANSGAIVLGNTGNTGNTGLPKRECIAGVFGGQAGGIQGQAAERTGVHAGGMADMQISGRRKECADTGGIAVGDRAQGLSTGSMHGRCDSGPGPTNGLWADADWLFCRDGKWRPVEPGTFPLAHGAPARVGRLRGYGNAINAKAAQAFVESLMEATA